MQATWVELDGSRWVRGTMLKDGQLVPAVIGHIKIEVPVADTKQDFGAVAMHLPTLAHALANAVLDVVEGVV